MPPEVSFYDALVCSPDGTKVIYSDARELVYTLTGEDLPDQTEYDLTVDYKPPRGLLTGLWVRARYVRLDIEGDGEKVRNIRIIVNYSIPFL